MPKKSAGILAYRHNIELQFFLVHPGGPYFTKKDLAVWTIPKGEFGDDEEPLLAAIREFKEETGFNPTGTYKQLTPIKQASGKVVHAWSVEFDLDADAISSNLFKIEWPPNSGLLTEFPEVDKGGWFNSEDAKRKIIPAQVAFLNELGLLLA